MSKRQQVLDALEARAHYNQVTVEELSDATGLTPKAIKDTISGMRYDGFPIEIVERGKAWRIANVYEEADTEKEYTEEDLEKGRRVLQNYDKLPEKVKASIEGLKAAVQPDQAQEIEALLVKLLDVAPRQDSDPTFWSVDEFADGSLLLARKDGTHWKATKL